MGAGGVGTRQWDIWNSILGRNGVLMGAPSLNNLVVDGTLNITNQVVYGIFLVVGKGLQRQDGLVLGGIAYKKQIGAWAVCGHTQGGI